MKEIYDLKDKLCSELKKYGTKELSAGSLDVIDKLAHTLKNLDRILDHMEEGEYSGAYMPRNGYMGTTGGMRSYARGRRYVRRDDMGRYSSSDGLAEELEAMMSEVPPELTGDVKRLVAKLRDM